MEKSKSLQDFEGQKSATREGGGGLLPIIKLLIDFLKPKSILDYGCGKGNLVKALEENYPNIKVYGYDPAVKDFDKLPTSTVDFLICSDVLEGIPENKLPETISQIAGLSKKVFFHLNHVKDTNVLDNGEKSHRTIYSPEQYANLFKHFFPTLNFLPGMGKVNTCCITFPLPQNIMANWDFLLHGNTVNYVDNLNALIQLIHSREEVIIFPLGGEGQQLLDFLRYSNFLNRICCIAAPQVKLGFKQDFIHGKPIIPFENLVHFRETGLLIVASAEDPQNSALNVALRRVGFKSVVFLKDTVNTQVKNELKKLYDSGQVLTWYLRHFDKNLNDLALRIDEQNEIAAVNTKAFSEYRNAFRGRKVVIVGGGPTAKYYTPIKDAIHIGLNFAWKKENISFDYLFTHDRVEALGTRNAPNLVYEGFDRIKNKVFVGRRVERQGNFWVNYPEDILFKSNNVVLYCIGATESFTGLNMPIYRDICNHPLMIYGSCVFQALQFTLFTYPSEIYLVGCDTTSNGHFYEEDNSNYYLSNKVKVGYARMKMFAKRHYPETKIISINPVGLRGLFKDIYTEEYRKSLDNGE